VSTGGGGPVDAVVVAAGRGTRFGAVDKVLLPLGGRPVLAWSLAALLRSDVHEVVVVAGAHTVDRITELVGGMGGGDRVRVVRGGTRRQDSVAAGVLALSDDGGPVVVHDGARPLLTPALVARVAGAVPAGGAAVVGAPVTDTLKRVGEAGRVLGTVPREGLWAVQTPQAFDREALRAAVAHPGFAVRDVTDEAGLFEASGHPVVVVPWDRPNPKLTHPGDLAMIEALADALGDAGPEETV
jgi:2-C-methyl-D-erythritol 4-phosphate cytidylyltransferase